MIDEKTLTRMVEHRDRELPLLRNVLNVERPWIKQPAARLCQTPEYLAYLVERGMQSLTAAGAAHPQAVQILAKALGVRTNPENEAALLEALWTEHFREAANDLLTIVDELRLIARNEIQPATFGYPPQGWLSGEITRDDANVQLGGRLDSIQVFPRSSFEADLQHFRILSYLGGRLYSYSSPPESWRLRMGRSGYALVDDGRSLAYLDTMMN